jgi:protein phosphatase
MGGCAAGERASQIAVEMISQELCEIGDGTPHAEVEERIRQAFSRANREIILSANLRGQFKGMGTTAVSALIRGRCVFVAAIGDSRAYVVRRGCITQLTVDHTRAQLLVENDLITPAEAAGHYGRHLLWKFLGAEEIGDEPDIRDIELYPHDGLLLLSDGVTNSLTDDALLEIVSTNKRPQMLADELVAKAQDGGATDDTTCVVVTVGGPKNEEGRRYKPW